MARPQKTSDAQGSESREAPSRENIPNPVWFKPIMFGFMLVGLAWIIVFYLSKGQFPVPGIDVWNIAIGFGFLIIGFFMTTRWR